MKKYIIIAIVIIIVSVFAVLNKNITILGGAGTVTTTASSTAYTITTTAVRVLATSTKRSAVTITPINCTASSVISLNLKEPDQAPTAFTGFGILSSTTQSFGDRNDPPTPQNSVRAINSSGTCTVLVTEFIQNF